MNGMNEQYERILLLVKDGKTFPEIAEALGIWKSQLSTTLKIMEQRGLIERRHEGRQLILTIPRTISNSLPTIPAYRIHNLWLTLKLKDRLPNDTTTLLRSRGISVQSRAILHNHTDSFFIQDGYEARLTPSSLEVHLPDLDGLPLEADLQQSVLDAFHKLETIVLRLEDRLGIKVVRLDKDTIMARISQLHIALKNHQFAETVNERGEKLYVYVEGELRVLVDASHGLHEYEGVHRTYAIPDAQKLGELTKAVITSQFDYKAEQEILHGTNSLLNHFAKTFVEHEAAYVEVANGSREAAQTNREVQATLGELRPMLKLVAEEHVKLREENHDLKERLEEAERRLDIKRKRKEKEKEGQRRLFKDDNAQNVMP